MKNVYWNMSVGLKWVLVSRTDPLLNLWRCCLKVAYLHKYLSRKFGCWIVFICSLNELCDDISAGVPEGDYVVSIMLCFQASGL